MAKTSAARGPAPDIDAMTKEWRRLRSQKHRLTGGVEARMLAALGIYLGEQAITQAGDQLISRVASKDEDKNRLSLVFNMIQKAVRKRIGHLNRVAPEFTATPNKTDARAYDKADVVRKLITATDQKLHERTTQWKRLRDVVLFGVALEHIPWVEATTEEAIPTLDEQGNPQWRIVSDGATAMHASLAKGTILPHSVVLQLVASNATPEWFEVVEELQIVGDVGSEIIHPLNFFIDAGCLTIADLAPDQGCFIVQLKTGGWVRDIFGNDAYRKLTANAGEDLSIIRTQLSDKGAALAGTNLRDLLPAVQASRAAGDPPLFLVATRYQPASQRFPKGRRTIFVPDQVALDDGDCYDGAIPIVDFHYDAPRETFWTPDFVTPLSVPQKFFNKRMSQLGESANASVYEVLLLGGELDKKDLPADMPGVVPDGLDEKGQPRVLPMQRGQLPAWFLESTLAVGKWLTDIAATDITQSQGQYGQIRGPLALPLLQELLDSEDGPFYEHLGEQLAAVRQMRVNRVKAYYPPMRTLQITGRNRKDETLVFHTDDILRAGVDYAITVDRSTLVPELSALRRARVLEDLNSPLAILYTNKRTGKLDASKIAMAIRYQDRDVEDREVQYRRLAQPLIAKLWRGEELPPEVPYPFWDHNTILDELEAVMATTEWLEASAPVRQAFIAFYERSRDYLAAIQQSQQDAVQSQMVQGAMAQASQQAAAKAAAVATDAALGQIQTSAAMARSQPPDDSVRAALQGSRSLPAGGGAPASPAPA